MRLPFFGFAVSFSDSVRLVSFWLRKRTINLGGSLSSWSKDEKASSLGMWRQEGTWSAERHKGRERNTRCKCREIHIHIRSTKSMTRHWVNALCTQWEADVLPRGRHMAVLCVVAVRLTLYFYSHGFALCPKYGRKVGAGGWTQLSLQYQNANWCLNYLHLKIYC